MIMNSYQTQDRRHKKLFQKQRRKKNICLTFLLILFLNISAISYLFAQKDKKEAIFVYEEAIELLEKGNYAQGYQLLDKCLKLDSTWLAPIFAKAFYKLEEGKNEEAESGFSEIIRRQPKDTASYIGRAEAYMNMGLYHKAIKDLETALKLDEKNAEALYKIAEAHLDAENPKTALGYADKAIGYYPNETRFLLLKSIIYTTEKEYEQAEKIALQALKLEPENIMAQKMRALILSEKGNHKEAIRIYEQILKKNPNVFEEEDFYFWAKSLYKTKNYKQALSITQSPKKIEKPELYYIQALCYFQLKKYAEAWKSINEAEKLQNNLSAEVYYDKAIIAHYAKKSQEAKESYLKALNVMPEIYLLRNENDEKADVLLNANPIFQREFSQRFLDSVLVSAYQERCLGILEKDKTAEALKDIEKALAIDSLNSKSYTIRGITYALMGKFQEANRDFEKAEKLPKGRDLGYLYLMRGLAAAEAQNMGQAIFYIDKAISHNPLQPNYHAEKAHLLFEIGDTEGAFKSIDKAIALAPKEVEYRLNKINFLHEEERYDDLLKECERVLEIDPDAIPAYYYRGMAHWAKKNKIQARKDLEFFLKYYPDDKDAQKALKLID
jgi:tetratricopeptide (TPR) repeat protein